MECIFAIFDTKCKQKKNHPRNTCFWDTKDKKNGFSAHHSIKRLGNKITKGIFRGAAQKSPRSAVAKVPQPNHLTDSPFLRKSVID